MSFGKRFDISAKYKQKHKRAASDWVDTFPGPADLNFNYRKLMDSAPNGIASNTNPDTRIAIVGAGITGLAAARELLRSGFTNIHVYEATDRIGGRHYTVYDDRLGFTEPQYTTFEGGAMRFPPFLSGGEVDPKNGECILSYYLNEFGYKTEGFPNPGSAFADTGIYYNDGFLSGEVAEPTMAIWPKTSTEPPTAALQNVYNKWNDFANRILTVVAPIYSSGNTEWQTFWHSFVNNYWKKTFRDVVLDPAIVYNPGDQGNFGGAGMTEDEATLFYVIGAGDGSWGAFFNLSFLYAYRTFIHGYGSDLYLMQGAFDDTGNYVPGPQFENESMVDSGGSKIASPRYLGTAAFYEGIFFQPINVPTGTGTITKSLYELLSDTSIDFKLWQNRPVNRIHRQSPISKIEITSDGGSVELYDAVVITVPSWVFDTKIDVTGFDSTTQWPFPLRTYLSRAHWEPACKVFVSLTEPYWENAAVNIPQMISTDTFVHDAYGVLVHQGADQKGGLLVSYTWWRDATRLLSYSDAELVQLCVNELDRVCTRSSNIGQSILPYVDFTNSWVIHWELQPTVKGAARLYDQREWNDTQIPMMYNQEYSASSSLYLAGEGYHVDAGWTEPCLRQAIDTVLYLAKNLAVPLAVTNFTFDTDYPRYDALYQPTP